MAKATNRVRHDGPSLAQADVSRYLPMVNALLDGAAPAEVADKMFTGAGFVLPRHDPAVRSDILATFTAPITWQQKRSEAWLNGRFPTPCSAGPLGLGISTCGRSRRRSTQ